ncbi:MAG: DinB family protein, partial [Pseudomonadota bacterium]
MITAEYCRVMARYNAWQNTQMRAAMRALSYRALTEERGAFFGSILKTANHLLWGDTIWMSRFDGWPKPQGGISSSVAFMPDFAMWDAARAQTDAKIIAWALDLDEARLEGALSWYSGAAQRDVSKPMRFCIAHFFNHQTHHRGQIHAML